VTAAPGGPFGFRAPERPDLAGALALDTGAGGLPRAVVTAGSATAHVYLHGAHLTHYAGADGHPALFLSERSRFEAGQPIRGGVPVVFPWFGPHPTDGDAPGHGVARTAGWRLLTVDRPDPGTVALELGLDAGEAGDPRGGAGWRLRYRLEIGPRLRLALSVEGPPEAPLRCEMALHTYLAVRDVRQVRVHGLEGVRYLDKTRGFHPTPGAAGPARLGPETDRVYPGHAGTVVVEDPGTGRRLRVDKTGSATTVLWNPGAARAARLPDLGPGEWTRFVCVETANVGADAVLLPPGGRHTMGAEITAGTSGPG
jgi:D-hexose-6-phosphate mutarotase